MNIAAKVIRNETICNGSKPSNTNSLKNRNEPPQKKETSSNVKKSFVFMIKKASKKRLFIKLKPYVGLRP